MKHDKDNDAVFVSLVDGDEKENEELTASLFTGDIAKWASVRAHKLGDMIIPKHVYVEWVDYEPHHVAWIEHYGTRTETEEKFHNHHVVCGCAYKRNMSGGENLVNIGACSVLENAVIARAQYVDRQYGFKETIGKFEPVLLGESDILFDYHDIVLESIKKLLVLDKNQPENWFGNTVSGAHLVPLVGEVIQQTSENVRLYADILAIQGEVEVSGDVMKLAA